ncbi:MAG: NTP transferase domain-containing protein [Erysipelotrichaceae bacterium]|nr:NTP transferase domain-containing protein [Erysipelotrichaceae bacterium]MDY5252755.1 NTP transferase domain-containing protein [Erysipelotrichaceae bacterium]
MQVIILCGGNGSKIAPYAQIRNKAAIKISNEPIVSHMVRILNKFADITKILVVGSYHMSEIKALLRYNDKVEVRQIEPTPGSAKTLEAISNMIEDEYLLLFGDCLIDEEDIANLLYAQKDTILVDKITDDPRNHIVAQIENDDLLNMLGHPRVIQEGYKMFGYHGDKTFIQQLPYNKGRFTNTKVGVGSPLEYFLEESINDHLQENKIKVIYAKHPCFDIDKPWDILAANAYYNHYYCSKIEKQNDSDKIDPSCICHGNLQLGKNVRVGKDVIIQGNCIIGDDSIIENGAIIGKDVVIGKRCKIANNCKIGDQSTVGDDSIIDQTAELLEGVLMGKDYLYHHCEFYGLCGEKVDIGAGTICGTLRFDDGESMHTINGRKEQAKAYANATFLGDHVRTGVGVIFQPGKIVGVNSVIGAGVILNQNVGDNKLIYCKQELIEEDWGTNKYGW